MNNQKTIQQRLEQAKNQLLSTRYLTKDVNHEDFLKPNTEKEIQAMEAELGFLFPDVYRFGLKLHRGILDAFYSGGWTNFRIQRKIGLHLEDLNANKKAFFDALAEEKKHPAFDQIINLKDKDLLKHKDQLLVLSHTERAVVWTFTKNRYTYFDGVEYIPHFDFVICDNSENPFLYQYGICRENDENGLFTNTPFCFDDDKDNTIKEKKCTMIDVVEAAVENLINRYQNIYY